MESTGGHGLTVMNLRMSFQKDKEMIFFPAQQAVQVYQRRRLCMKLDE